MKIIDKVRLYIMYIIIAFLASSLMVLFSGLFPFSIIYKWLAYNELTYVWGGLSAGFISLCIGFYRVRFYRNSKEKKSQNED